MFTDVQKLLETSSWITDLGPRVLSLSPIDIRNELDQEVQEIQARSSIIQKMKPGTAYVIMGEDDSTSPVYLDGKNLLTFTISFPDFHFIFCSHTKSGMEQEVKVFETKYLKLYEKECRRINEYKRRLARCFELKDVTLLTVVLLHSRMRILKERCGKRLENEPSLTGRLRYCSLVIEATLFLETLKLELNRRQTESNLPMKGP